MLTFRFSLSYAEMTDENEEKQIKVCEVSQTSIIFLQVSEVLSLTKSDAPADNKGLAAGY